MVSSSKVRHPILPQSGKRQINLRKLKWVPDPRKFVTLFLPCSHTKPYYQSTTHQYIEYFLRKELPTNWFEGLVQVCTISEVLGIVPRDIEDSIFFESNKSKFYYEHYPKINENDINQTADWLSNFIEDFTLINNVNVGYCTSEVFRQICERSEIPFFPKTVVKKSALYEFRNQKKAQELVDFIKDAYIKEIINRVLQWKSNHNKLFKIIRFASKNNGSISLKVLKKEMPSLKRPHLVLSRLTRESGKGTGILLRKENNEEGCYNLIPCIEEKLLNLRIS